MSRKLPILLVAIALLWPAVAGAADQSVWPLTPYQVRVFVAVASEAPLTPRLEADLLTDLSARIEAVVGPPWNVTVAAPPPAFRRVEPKLQRLARPKRDELADLRRDMLHGLDTLQADKIPIPSPEPDKILFVTVTVAPGGLIVTARDFDVHTRTLSYPVTRPIWQIGSLCDACLDGLLSAFTPLARVDRIEYEDRKVDPNEKNKGKDNKDAKTTKDMFAVFRVKAAGLPTRDRNLALLRVGDVFRPLVCYKNRDNKYLGTTRSRWSLCVVEKIAPEEVRCRVHSGVRGGEMPTKGRGRAESLALRVLSPGGSTTVVLQSRTPPPKPLAGCDVYAYPPDKRDAVTLLGQTDRQGRVLVPTLPGTLMRVLLVKNGASLLAKLPIVPGIEHQLTADIPDDDQRLGAEGFSTGLQEEVFDIVARQKILIARIRTRIEAKQFEEAAKLAEELRRLPTAQQFNLRLAREQEILATKDPSIQKKIDMLLDDTRKLIDKCLDPEILDNLDRDLRDAKDAGTK